MNDDEYPQAFEKAFMGYKMLADPARLADAQKQIGVNELWKKAASPNRGEPLRTKRPALTRSDGRHAFSTMPRPTCGWNNFDEAGSTAGAP
ncbi:MAG: hypothetical protein WKG07_01040 [Hymenobacter sp.]